METAVDDKGMHNSLKRDRYAFIDDIAFDQEESNRSQKKPKITSDTAIPTGQASTDTATADERLTRSPTDVNIDKSGADSAPTDSSITCEDQSLSSKEARPEPSLQTLPRELRDMIYEFIAETEDRIVLGRRMLEARKANNTWTLDKCFDEAVALHPLSMTCWQFRNEFQPVHFSARRPWWILLVNNFDLEQLQIFSDYIQSEEFIKVRDDWYWGEEGDADELYGVPAYNTSVSLRFQIDDDAQHSAGQLCKHVLYRRGDAPASLCDDEAYKKWLGLAEISTGYVRRTKDLAERTKPAWYYRKSMTPDEAKVIRSAFEDLRDHIERTPNYDEAVEPFLSKRLASICPSRLATCSIAGFESLTKP